MEFDCKLWFVLTKFEYDFADIARNLISLDVDIFALVLQQLSLLIFFKALVPLSVAVSSPMVSVLSMADPRTKDWLLLNNSPVYVWLLTVTYLSFIFVGPKVMKNRMAFSLQGLMFFYNMALVGLSIYMFVEVNEKGLLPLCHLHVSVPLKVCRLC